MWPELRLNVEVDGSHHLRERTKHDDERRDAKLRAAAGSPSKRPTGWFGECVIVAATK